MTPEGKGGEENLDWIPDFYLSPVRKNGVALRVVLYSSLFDFTQGSKQYLFYLSSQWPAYGGYS